MERAGRHPGPTLHRYAFRLEDLRSWHVVTAICAKCRRQSVIAHDALTHGRQGQLRPRD